MIDFLIGAGLHLQGFDRGARPPTTSLFPKLIGLPHTSVPAATTT